MAWEEWRFGNPDVYFRTMPFSGDVLVCGGAE